MESQFRPSESELQDQVLRLSQENRELKEYAERVTKELRRYQQARPAPPSRPEDDVPLPPWATNMQMMSPLLFSYEERITELEAVIERSASLAEQTQALAKENDSLRAELQERTEQFRRSQLMAPVRELSSTDQQEELQELYRLSVEQNEALAQQNQLLKLQLERMQQSLIAHQQQVREKAQVEERAEAFARQRSAVEKRLEEVNGELIEEIRIREQVQRQFEGLQHDFQMQSQSLEMCKRNLEERSSLALDEEERLKVELTRATRNDKDQRHRISSLELDLAQASEALTVTRREADGTKQEAEQLVRLVDSYERTLTDIRERHDDVRQKLSAQEAKVRELLLEKDRWSSAESAAQRQSERLQSRLQGEVETLRQQRDMDIENLKSTHAREKSSREEKLRKTEQSAAELQMKMELAEKQRSWESSSLESQSSLHSAERARLQSDLEEAQQVRLRLERQVDSVRQEGTRLRTELEAMTAEARESTSTAGSEAASCRSKVQQSERTLSRLREELQNAEGRVSQMSADHTRLQSELQEERFRVGDEAERERRKALAERRAMERQLQGVASKAQQGEQRAVELLRAQEMLQQQLQAEFSAETQALDSQVKQLSAENRTMREKSRGLLKALAVRRLASGDSEDVARTDLLALP